MIFKGKYRAKKYSDSIFFYEMKSLNKSELQVKVVTFSTAVTGLKKHHKLLILLLLKIIQKTEL